MPCPFPDSFGVFDTLKALSPLMKYFNRKPTMECIDVNDTCMDAWNDKLLDLSDTCYSGIPYIKISLRELCLKQRSHGE
jgi:hypothetical protein